MDEETKQLHLEMGRLCGEDVVCVNQKTNQRKVDYKSFETAKKQADKLSAKYGHEMEGYPCAFCGGWHIGRKMTREEMVEAIEQKK